MAEMVMKKLVAEKHLSDRFVIDSAAVSTEELGNSIYPPAKRTLRMHNVPFTEHFARQVTRSDYTDFDLLICMDSNNIRWLGRFIPQSDPDNKVHLLMEYTGSYRDVADPWYTGDFEATYRDVVEGCSKLLETIA